jgi:hypothetical protein
MRKCLSRRRVATPRDSHAARRDHADHDDHDAGAHDPGNHDPIRLLWRRYQNVSTVYEAFR